MNKTMKKVITVLMMVVFTVLIAGWVKSKFVCKFPSGIEFIMQSAVGAVFALRESV